MRAILLVNHGETNMKPKTGIRKQKAGRVEEHLRNMLLPLPEGTRLPGIRELMKTTGAGQIVVCSVLQNLQEDGLIRIDPRQGIFRTAASEQFKEIRLLHWSLNEWQSSDFIGILSPVLTLIIYGFFEKGSSINLSYFLG